MWDPQTYLTYADERTRPARDLLAAVDVSDPRRVVDLGCGTGTSTRLLAARWPGADVLGTDSSAEMIAAAREEPPQSREEPPPAREESPQSREESPPAREEPPPAREEPPQSREEPPPAREESPPARKESPPAREEPPPARSGRLRYEVADAATWQPEGPVDVWFSNAMLQWLPGHLDLLPRWLATLTPGGRLAFGVPANFDAPHHVLLRELCAAPAWRDRLGGISERHEAVHTPARYADALAAAGARPDVWETTYLHRLSGPDPVLAWTAGTALRPVLKVLDGDTAAREAFLAEYGAAVRTAYPPGPDGVTTFPFRRIFAVAAPA